MPAESPLLPADDIEELTALQEPPTQFEEIESEHGQREVEDYDPLEDYNMQEPPQTQDDRVQTQKTNQTYYEPSPSADEPLMEDDAEMESLADEPPLAQVESPP